MAGVIDGYVAALRHDLTSIRGSSAASRTEWRRISGTRPKPNRRDRRPRPSNTVTRFGFAREIAVQFAAEWQTSRSLFWKLTNVGSIVLAGMAYLFIAAIASSSFDRSAAWLGPCKWRLLHLVGRWCIWISFDVAVGKRMPIDRIYWPLAALMLPAAIVRLIAMFRRNSRPAAISAP